MSITDNRFRNYYQTDRLILKILDERSIAPVLEFLNKGAPVFDQYESTKPADYYTTATQKKILRAEYNFALQKTGVRFWVSLKNRPDELIGTISFSFYKTAPFHSIMLGYKLLPDYWHQGYGTESVKAAIQIICPVMGIKRVEAFVLPENTPSQTLLSRVGFTLEGTAYRCAEVQGIRRDHLQYSYNVN
ncbi:MAG: GNAT family N-acetyltransferase [Lachnospiraceae bacterium]